jgi:hypothetical protein
LSQHMTCSNTTNVDNNYATTVVGPPATTTAIADTGSTAHFFTIDSKHLINQKPALTPIAIRNPNGSIMYSTHIADLNIPSIPSGARHVHLVPELSSHSLLSMGQLCDAGCHVAFDATTVTISYNDNVVLSGYRTPDTKLWHIDLPPTTLLAQLTPATAPSANAAIGSATPSQLVAFAHAALFSPALSTLATALDKNFITNFPGLTPRSLRRYPPQSPAMVKGHLDQLRKNQKSTKPTQLPPEPSEPDDEPFPESANAKSHHCYTAIIEPTGQIYTDQTGKFIVPSSTGNNYLLVLYDYDTNSIWAEPFKTRAAKDIVTAYSTLHTALCRIGLRPQLQRLDNECPEALKDYMADQQVDFQLVPPGVHRRNAAERAIRTFKNHLIAGLCSVDKDFPLHLWDRLIPQALLTLNLLRGSRLNPNLSAWAHTHGHFDFNRTPIAPPGIRVLAHEKPNNRTTWSPHALDGWYVGPALQSYRCYNIWIWDTRAERICDTVVWFPTKITMPLASTTDLILAALQDLRCALSMPNTNSPLAPSTDSHSALLHRLTAILNGPTTTINTTPAPANLIPTPQLAPPPGFPPLPTARDHPAPPLRVESPQLQSPATSLRVDSTPLAPSPTVQWKDPSIASTTTYENSTGPRGRQRRKKARKAKMATLSPIPTLTANSAITAEPHAKLSPPITMANTEHFALHGNAFNPDTGQLADYDELSRCSEGPLWIESCKDEFGRLCQGHGTKMPTGTDTMFFIPVTAIPKGRKATYLRIVAAYRPEKENPRRVRFTVGGDRIDYAGDVSTKTADLTTVKALLNSVLSTPNAKLMTADLKDFYLNTPLTTYEYMRIPISVIPQDIIDQYQLEPLIHNNAVYVEIRKGMYGLPQAGRIANDQLIAKLTPHGYAPVPITPGLWKHSTADTVFSLVVDDFAIKYTSEADAHHLLNALKQDYKVSEDWQGQRYCGLTLEWDYAQRTCDISMPGYIERALQRFQHPPPARPQHSPHAWQRPDYGKATQYAPTPDTSPPLDAADSKRVQEVLGTLLFYARAVDSTMLAAIGTLAAQQARGTQHTMRGITHLLNYCATHPNAVVRFVASDMILHVESDASYLSEPKARSRAAGYYYLSDLPLAPNSPPAPTTPQPRENGAINILCQILREVVSSAAEAELAALFHNGKEACPIRICLEELGHPQPPTPIQTDNSTAAGIANDTVKQKRSKAIDMRFYWIRDRVRQKQFHIFWKKGSLNKADYFTKHHPASHHQQIRSAYLHSPTAPTKNYFECLGDTDNEPTAASCTTTRTAGSTTATTTAVAPSSTSTSCLGEGVLNPRESRTQGTRNRGFPFSILRTAENHSEPFSRRSPP